MVGGEERTGQSDMDGGIRCGGKGETCCKVEDEAEIFNIREMPVKDMKNDLHKSRKRCSVQMLNLNYHCGYWGIYTLKRHIKKERRGKGD